jgi:hypothetical protein
MSKDTKKTLLLISSIPFLIVYFVILYFFGVRSFGVWMFLGIIGVFLSVFWPPLIGYLIWKEPVNISTQLLPVQFPENRFQTNATKITYIIIFIMGTLPFFLFATGLFDVILKLIFY